MTPAENKSQMPPKLMADDHRSVAGARHWWWQRVSALMLVPLTLWFVFAILNHIGDAQQNAVAWVAQPGVAVALSVYLLVLFFHSYLGLQVIVEDYISSQKICRATLLALKIISTFGALVALWSVLHIAMQ